MSRFIQCACFLLYISISEVWGYKEEDIVMLTDDASNPRQIPTRDNIVSTYVGVVWRVLGFDFIGTAPCDAMARSGCSA